MTRTYLPKTRAILAALVEAETTIHALALRFEVPTKTVRAVLDRHIESGAVTRRRVVRPGLPEISMWHIPDASALPTEAVVPAHPPTRCRQGMARYQARRPCMCCRKTFYSEGPHNRLCGICRPKSITPFDL